MLSESQRLALLRPAIWQPTVIGEFIGGEPDWLTTVEDGGDDVGGEEAHPDDAGDVGRGDAFGGREFADPEPLGQHAVAQVLGTQD